MKIDSDKPILLFTLTIALLCFALGQGLYLIIIAYGLPTLIEVEASSWVQLGSKIAVCLYLICGCTLLLRSRRCGVLLVEFAILFSLVSFGWRTLETWYHLHVQELMPSVFAWMLHIGFFLAVIAAHLVYLRCIRSEKVMVYFNLHLERDV